MFNFGFANAAFLCNNVAIQNTLSLQKEKVKEPFAIYYPVKLIECPPQWDYYKELIYNTALIIFKEDDAEKYYFFFGGLRSSYFRSFETWQLSLKDDIYIDIVTKNNSHYVFVCDGRFKNGNFFS